jgi:hypothetical protein
MRWADLADQANRACRAQFPATVSIDPAGSAPAEEIAAIFDEAAEVIEVDNDGNPFDTTRPMIDVRAADLTFTPKIGDAVTVTPQARTGQVTTARDFEIISVRPSSNGDMVCYLMEV